MSIIGQEGNSTGMMGYDNVKVIVLDVDGTMTDGGLLYDTSGTESKRFSVKDGLAIKVAIEAGFTIIVISGRSNSMVERRVSELGIQFYISDAQVKYPILLRFLEEHSFLLEEVCYIGDDWNDLQCMREAGICMCPADAVSEVKATCTFVSSFNGGHGAVRDCLEELLKRRGERDNACKKLYFAE